MSDFSQLTDRQREIYEFIRIKIESRGYGPTVREIGEAFEIKSPNGVMCHLKALSKKGLILREDRSARAIQLVNHRRPSGARCSPCKRSMRASRSETRIRTERPRRTVGISPLATSS